MGGILNSPAFELFAFATMWLPTQNRISLLYWQASNLQAIYIKIVFGKTWSTWCVISIIAKNKLHAHHKTHLHTMKVYIASPSTFCSLKILLFFDHWSIHLFQSNQRVQAIEFVDRPFPKKLYIFRINLPIKAFPCVAFRHTKILIPSFHGLC